MSGQRHPDTEALARLRAGLAGGLRSRRLASHVAHCARCASISEELGAVTSVLASVPAPTMPEAIESRITAALSAESAARQPAVTSAAAASEPAERLAAGHRAPPSRSSRSSRPPRSRSGQLSLRLRPAMAVIPVIALVLAGFGYLLSHSSPSASSNSAASEAAPETSASAAAPAAKSGARALPSAELGGRPFPVTVSGTRYEAATLRAQVLSQLASHSQSNASAPSAVPSAPSAAQSQFGDSGGSGASGTTSAASRALVGCALRLTSGVLPTLVDRATYEGRPVYVIAVPNRAWVVPLGCTASDPRVIATVALSGAP